ncbi:hypothetical protein [Nocardia sp. NPDC051750]|uniref:hypothetical protein n=1 Tax=Nocardia sp. NPDC051750 TaxID=3364325 RepID=UPI00378C86F5
MRSLIPLERSKATHLNRKQYVRRRYPDRHRPGQLSLARFQLSGAPVKDLEALAQMDIYADETAVEVPKSERSFYGNAAVAG